MTVNAAGSRMYAVNTGDGSLSTCDTTTALAPHETQHVVLRNLGPAFVDPTGMTQPISSAPFQEALDPANQHLYVVTQRVTTDPSFTRGNAVHFLDVDADGNLMEEGNVELAVPPEARAQGLVVF